MESGNEQKVTGLHPSDFQQNLEPLVTETVELVNEQLPSQLLIWLENKFTVNNLSELSQQVLESTVASVVENKHETLHLSQWAELDNQTYQKCSETWLLTLEALVKHSSSYDDLLKIRLELYRSVPPEEFKRFSDKSLQKLETQVKDPLLLQMVNQTCSKITKIYEDTNNWMLQNKLNLENQINQILEQYGKELVNCDFPSISYHAQLKEKYVQELETRFKDFEVPPIFQKRILVSYQVQLCGLLNASFDVNARKRKRVAESTQTSTDTGVDTGEMQSWEPDDDHEASTSTSGRRQLTRSFADMNSILDSMDESVTNIVQVGGTLIHYFKKPIISSGNTAKVYRGFYGNNIRGYLAAAVKKFPEKYSQNFYNELSVWKQVNATNNYSNVNVVGLLDCGKSDNHFFLATELADMDLAKRIEQLKLKPSTNYGKLVTYVKHMTTGLHWLHGRHIIHRDIKPHNVLIFSYEHDGKKEEVAKLTDFDVSRVVKVEDTGRDTHAAGTDDWSPPEVLEARKQRQKFPNKRSQDIFSLGLTSFFTLTLGSHPFEYSEYNGHIKSWNILDEKVSPTKLKQDPVADDVIQRMLHRNPEKRPSAYEILRSPLFWSTSKKLNFIIDFAVAIGEGKDEQVKSTRESLDKAYLKMYEETKDKKPSQFDWLSELDEEKREKLAYRKTSENPTKKFDKDQNENSVSSLVKLIRDKYQHRLDLVDELLQDKHFGRDGQFDEDKYVEYFLKTFPDLLIFLIKQLSGSKLFEKIREKYKVF